MIDDDRLTDSQFRRSRGPDGQRVKGSRGSGPGAGPVPDLHLIQFMKTCLWI